MRTALPLADRLATAVELPPPRLLHQDLLSLSDVLIAASGAVCCLRREPGRAELVVWPDRPGVGAPVSWTGPPAHPIIRTFGFDGAEAFAWTDDAILRITADGLERVVDGTGSIIGAELSGDRARLLWRERLPDPDDPFEARVYTIDRAGRRARTIETAHPCLDALWLPDGGIATVEAAGSRSLLGRYSADLEPAGALLEAAGWAFRLDAVDPVASTLYVSGSETRSARTAGCAVWALGLGDGGLVCLAVGAAPGGGSVAPVPAGCLFADQWQQTATRSSLVCATRRDLRRADCPAFLRSFCAAPDRDEVLFAGGEKLRGLYALDVGRLVPSRRE